MKIEDIFNAIDKRFGDVWVAIFIALSVFSLVAVILGFMYLALRISIFFLVIPPLLALWMAREAVMRPGKASCPTGQKCAKCETQCARRAEEADV